MIMYINPNGSLYALSTTATVHAVFYELESIKGKKVFATYNELYSFIKRNKLEIFE